MNSEHPACEGKNDLNAIQPPPPRIGRANPAAQFFWYLIVGGTAFLCDFAFFLGLLRIGVDAVLAAAAGFVVGALVNYVLSLRLAFVGGRYGVSGELIRLFAVALVGLGVTTLLVWVFLQLGLGPISAKLVAVLIALVWNYLGRRKFVFHRDMPNASWRVSNAVIARLTRRGSPGDHQ